MAWSGNHSPRRGGVGYGAAMRRMLLIALCLAAGCSSKDAKPAPATQVPTAPAKKAAPDQDAAPAVTKLVTAEQVCEALTPAEVEAELHIKTTAKMLPKAGEYSAPSCGWHVSTEKDAAGVDVTMFFQDNLADAKEYFGKKLEDVCLDYQTNKDARLVVPDLGDEAAFCGQLWVRQGTSFFSLTTPGAPTTDIEAWKLHQINLVKNVLPRLP
jgi:hypothetical protein